MLWYMYAWLSSFVFDLFIAPDDVFSFKVIFIMSVCVNNYMYFCVLIKIEEMVKKLERYKQCRYVMFKGTMTKWPVQKLIYRMTQQHVQNHDATYI